MSERTADAPASANDGLPRPRLAWLAVFQIVIIALVLVLARETRGMLEPPMLEERLGALAEGDPAGAAPWGGRGWLAALVAMVGALLLMLPVAWAYVATRTRREVDSSVVTTIVLLPIAVAAILVIVQDSLAVAFSLAGIAGLVRFRNALDDTRDAMYVVIAIAVGLGAGVGTLEASAALTGLYVLSVAALWKWQTTRPVIADVALGERRIPEGGTVLDAIAHDGQRHPEPTAEWLETEGAVPLTAGAAPRLPGKREGTLRVHAGDDAEIRRAVEEVLETHTKRWSLESEEPHADGLPLLTYSVRLRKRMPSEALLEVMRQRLGPTLAEYTPMRSEASASHEPAA